LFAFGQIGSGKTFTMVGTEQEPGLIITVCEALIERARLEGREISLTASYLELYNEKVRDLLHSPAEERPQLRIREHPTEGPFVENLSQHDASTAENIRHLVFRGQQHRRTASVDLNDSSNRGHAIFTLVLRQFTVKNGLEVQTTSRINLVDLAGFE
ncbi:uncharacterized protein MONBRDRAFT_3301, partial [Monosiga brevicollis MX1]